MNYKTKKPSYRLRKNVTYSAIKDTPQLQLSYPLKATRLNSAWDNVFQIFKTGDYIELEKIASILNYSLTDEVEFFLNGLVRNGFLEQRGTSAVSEYPLVSVIIPVRNRPKDIKGCLESLAQLNYPQEKLEIIVEELELFQ